MFLCLNIQVGGKTICCKGRPTLCAANPSNSVRVAGCKGPRAGAACFARLRGGFWGSKGSWWRWDLNQRALRVAGFLGFPELPMPLHASGVCTGLSGSAGKPNIGRQPGKSGAALGEAARTAGSDCGWGGSRPVLPLKVKASACRCTFQCNHTFARLVVSCLSTCD